MARSELISGLAQERQLVNRHAENTDADGPSVPLPSSRRNRSISSLFAPEEDSYMEFSPAMRDAIRRQRHQPHGLQVVDSPSDTESIRPAIERPLPTLRPLSRPIRPVSYNSRETRHPPSSGHSSRSMESDEVPFSTQAAAIFASRSTSPSSDHLAHHSAGGRQVPIPAPPPDSHTSRSPSPFPWASLRSLTPPPIPSSDMVRRRASMRSAMNAPTLFASSPPPPSDRQDSQRRAITAASSTNTRDQPQSARSINVNAYHDGPFRASIERLVEIDRLRNRIRDLESIDSYDDAMDPTLSRPPSLPPLTFDHEPLNTFPRRPSSVSRPVAPRVSFRSFTWSQLTLLSPIIFSQITVAEAASSSRARPEQRSRIPEGLATPVIHSRDDIIDREPRSFRRYRPVRQPRPVSPMLADTGTPTEGARDRRHLHTLLGRFPPAARAPDESPTSAASSAGGFAQAFAPIRGEGIGERHRQLVESQQAARRGAPAQWGAVQDDTRLASARRERERARERDMMRDSSMFPYEFFDIAPDGLAEPPLGAPARRASSVSRYHRLVRDREGGPGPDAFQRLQRLRAGLQGTRNVGDFVVCRISALPLRWYAD
ncbi:hypothetical protein BV25DRAFT_1629300 [Artomyces pyxidatus]|uniref:Uncharacterized protein n=1 Tax=Artomyces pyxidatus TaxID=48021 RepID=A0ACB8SKE3_9AGAM|nr:hypothetical protein BV25DRAFT_1629300 [Artomyces pyxidatus]